MNLPEQPRRAFSELPAETRELVARALEWAAHRAISTTYRGDPFDFVEDIAVKIAFEARVVRSGDRVGVPAEFDHGDDYLSKLTKGD